MKWDALKNLSCPKCGAHPLDLSGDFYRCHFFNIKCDFVISKTKFEKVVNSLYQPRKYVSQEERDAELNNL